MNRHRLLLLLLTVVVGLVGCEREAGNAPATLEADSMTTGLTDYDWLPKQLQHTMHHLVRLHPDRHFDFYYYFDTEDINRNYYMIDPGLKVIEEVPVTNENALLHIEDQLYDVRARKRGISTSWDTLNFRRPLSSGERSTYVLPFTTYVYVLPNDSADFSQLRVAIVEDTAAYSLEKYTGPDDLVVYQLNEVDVPPRPVRGIDYFRNVIMREVQDAEVFSLYDTGTVEISFTVWGHRAHSPNLVRGFSTHSDAHEAYQADGEFIKAINSAKVWWHNAQKDDRSVRSEMHVTFDITTLKK